MGKRERRRRRREREVAEAAAPLPARRVASLRQVPVADQSTARDLASLASHLKCLEQAVDDEVDRLVAAGVGWPQIAVALGVTRQAARQRWLRRHAG